MQNPRIASRYAKSLLDLAIERNSVEEALKDMRALEHVCRVSNEFEVMLRSPVISGQKKIAVINMIMGDSLSELTLGFIKLLVTKGREQFLDGIVTSFIEQYNLLKNIRSVSVTTAAPMDEKMKATIAAKVAAFMPGATLDMTTSVDENLIGGFVLQVGDQLFDASIRKKLNDVKSSIVDYSYVSKM